MRRFLFALGVTLSPALARAQAGTAFSDTSRVAALASAVSARPGDAGSILQNPAGLADLTEAEVVFTGHGDRIDQSFTRSGEAAQDRSRWLGGFGFAAATPLPGPDWVRHFRVGVALDLPAQYILRVHVPVRDDEPISPIYDGRPDRMAALAAIGLDVGRIKVGAGFTVTPSLELPTQVTYVAGRDPDVNRSVEVRIDSKLDLSATPFLGVRAQVTDGAAFSFVYRGAQVSHASGTQQTIAGGILANDPIDFFQMWDPAELVFGGAFRFSSRVSLSVDATWHVWSEFCTGHDQCAHPPVGSAQPALPIALQFHDTLSLRSGLEVRATRALIVRGGIAVEPSPIPTQSGLTNYLGANAMVFGLGAGLDFRRIANLPLVLDAHFRARVDALESARKQTSQLPDADTTLPGQQIDNAGYPGFQSRAFALQLGVTATIFLGGAR